MMLNTTAYDYKILSESAAVFLTTAFAALSCSIATATGIEPEKAEALPKAAKTQFHHFRLNSSKGDPELDVSSETKWKQGGTATATRSPKSATRQKFRLMSRVASPPTSGKREKAGPSDLEPVIESAESNPGDEGKVPTEQTPTERHTVPQQTDSASEGTESGTVEAVRKPPEPKVQTLRLHSRSSGLRFRTDSESSPGPDKTVETPSPAIVDSEESSSLPTDSIFAGLFDSRKANKSTSPGSDLPSRAEYSPFKVEKRAGADDDTGHGHSLGLSDEVIPFTEFGAGLQKRQKTLTEVIEDKHFPENIERLKKIEERPLDDIDMELPERKTLFGKDRFLSPGPIDPGIVMPSGATWRPSFMLFGNLRTAIQSYEPAAGARINEWANRLDIFGNLYLTSTERLLIGFRPLDEEGIFTGVAGGPGIRNEGFQNGFDFEPHTFFFEGYIDEIFPFLDPNDFNGHDYGFSFGRQPFSLQQGIMANDDIDALAITKHNMFLLGASNARVSAWFGFNEIHRGNNERDSGARLFALTSALDYRKRTIEADLVYVDGSRRDGGDGLYFGLGHIAQIGYWNSTFRLNRSFALNRKTAAIDDGWLLTHQLSKRMRHSEDILTLSSFAEIDNYTSAARGPATGGPLGGFSLLQRAVGLGNYGSAFSQEEGDQIGQIVSYQHFLDETARKQILVAGGISKSLNDQFGPDFTAALGIQYQQAISKHTLWRIGGFGTITEDGDKGFGLRTELQRKF